jgi:hypothetical protein
MTFTLNITAVMSAKQLEGLQQMTWLKTKSLSETSGECCEWQTTMNNG